MLALELVIIVLLVLLNGFLAMSEFAVVSSRRTRLERLAADGHPGARAALQLANEPGRFLAALQVGLTSISILAGAFSGLTLARRVDAWLDQFPAVASYSKPVAVVIVVLGVTYLSLVVGELAPKQIALKNPEAIAVRVARPLLAFTRVTAPLVWLLNLSTVSLLGMFGFRPGFERRLTDEDIIGVLIEGEKSGLIHAAEREMIEDVLDLADRSVGTIMTPRPDVAWIDIEAPQAVIAKSVRDCPYPQVLACRGTIDKLVGIVRKQDLLEQALEHGSLDVTKALQSPLIIPERTSILRTLDLFRQTPVNAAVIVDEYGIVQGIVTRTDLLEAVAGRLPDVDLKSDRRVIRRPDGSLVIDGATPIPDVAQLLDLDDAAEKDFVTVAGLVLSKLDHVPEPGEQVSCGGWRFEIAAMDGARISKVLARPGSGTPQNRHEQ
jgi:magnesium and cobalt exporter, CNNM family